MNINSLGTYAGSMTKASIFNLSLLWGPSEGQWHLGSEGILTVNVHSRMRILTKKIFSVRIPWVNGGRDPGERVWGHFTKCLVGGEGPARDEKK